MRTLAATVSVAAASLALLAAGLHAGQAGADPGPESGPREVITVRFAGEMANLEAFGTFGSFLFQGNLLSPSGAVVGSLVHRGRCSTTTPPPCLVFEVEDIFRLPGGDIVSRGKQSAAPDPQAPGQFLVGVYPPESRIVSTTGAFQGRGGHVRMSGRDDCTSCPTFAVLDDVWLIELDPPA